MTTVWRTQLALEDAGLGSAYEVARKWAVGPRQVFDLPLEPESGEWVNASVGSSARALVSPDFSLSPYAGQPEVGAWALSVARADQRNGLRWQVEVACEHADAGCTQVTITVSRNAVEGRAPRLEEVDVVAPGVCGALLRRFTCRNVPPLPPRLTSQAEVAEMLGAVTAGDRSVPLVVVSEDNWTHECLVSPSELSSQLVGTAVVVRLTKEGSLALRGALEGMGLTSTDAKRWGVYNGAVRVYLPGCDITRHSPYWHPLHLPEAVDQSGFVSALREWIFELSALSPPKPFRGQSTLRIEQLRVKVDDTTNAQAALELAEEYEAKVAEERAARENDAKRWQERIRLLELELEPYRRAARDAEEETQGLPNDEEERLAALAYFCRNGKRPALDWVDTLPEEERDAALQHLSDLPRAAFEKSAKLSKLKVGKPGSLQSQLWEYRANTKGLWLRFFVARSAKRNQILVLSGYAKKQNTLDGGEIDKAAKCLDEARKSGWA